MPQLDSCGRQILEVGSQQARRLQGRRRKRVLHPLRSPRKDPPPEGGGGALRVRGGVVTWMSTASDNSQKERESGPHESPPPSNPHLALAESAQATSGSGEASNPSDPKETLSDSPGRGEVSAETRSPFCPFTHGGPGPRNVSARAAPQSFGAEGAGWAPGTLTTRRQSCRAAQARPAPAPPSPGALPPQ